MASAEEKLLKKLSNPKTIAEETATKVRTVYTYSQIQMVSKYTSVDKNGDKLVKVYVRGLSHLKDQISEYIEIRIKKWPHK